MDRLPRARILKREEVEMGSEPVPVPPGKEPGEAKRHAGKPVVTHQRDEDGAVRRITVECVCGRSITLKCNYEQEEDA